MPDLPVEASKPPDLSIAIELRDQHGAFTLDASFRLGPGWSVLFGPSGSGKSTILRLVAGLDRPRSGRIVLSPTSSGSGAVTLTDTACGVHLVPERRGVRLLAQRPALFPHRSVLDNITYAVRHQAKNIEAIPQQQRRFEQIVTLCGIGHLLSRRPSGLSGGERQRVGLARTLMAEPVSLLLLDEPFTGLSAGARDSLIHDLRAWLLPRNIPVLLVTHDLGEVFACGGAVLRLEDGRITATGPAAIVLAAERAAMRQRISDPMPVGDPMSPA